MMVAGRAAPVYGGRNGFRTGEAHKNGRKAWCIIHTHTGGSEEAVLVLVPALPEQVVGRVRGRGRLEHVEAAPEPEEGLVGEVGDMV